MPYVKGYAEIFTTTITLKALFRYQSKAFHQRPAEGVQVTSTSSAVRWPCQYARGNVQQQKDCSPFGFGRKMLFRLQLYIDVCLIIEIFDTYSPHCDDVIGSMDVEQRGKYQPLAKVYSCTFPMTIYNIYHSLLLPLNQSTEHVRFGRFSDNQRQNILGILKTTHFFRVPSQNQCCCLM